MRIAEQSPAQVAQRIADGEALQIVDCREHIELSMVSLPDVIHIPLGLMEERADELDPSVPVVVMCHHGVRSLTGAMILMRAGFSQVCSMRGGIDLWARSVDPSVGRY
jgi:rhodanese-related sulfurtransferase